VALCTCREARAELTMPLVAPIPVTVDSSSAAAMQVVTDAREAYQMAWDQREAGNRAGALRTTEQTLTAIAPVLERNLDASTRRELVDIQSKLEGLRGTVKDPNSDGKGSDAADARVLNAPAVEEIEPQYNTEVYRYIEYFTGAGRSVFERWLVRSGRYMTLFQNVFKKEGLPPDLVHLVFVESGFNLHARSVSAAVGPWQFLRSTGRLFGLTVNQWVDERKDPEKSTVAAARYLKHLYSIFGDWPLALASYNAGEGTVLRAIKAQGTTNYWDLRLPRQTEDYVPQFMAVLAISREPEKYGFDEIELDQPMDFDEIALKGTVDLRAIAKFAECSYDEMKLLNPAVLRHAAPGQDGITMLRVPRGKADLILSKLQDGASLPSVELSVKHRVRKNETLQGIANQYHVGASSLAQANGISRSSPLKRGMVLTVPASLRGPAPAEIDQSDPRASTAYVPARDIRLPATSLDAESDAEGRTCHTVRKGETLDMIANQYGVAVSDIKQWNHLKTSSVRRGTGSRSGSAKPPSPLPSRWPPTAPASRCSSRRPPHGATTGAGARSRPTAPSVCRAATRSRIWPSGTGPRSRSSSRPTASTPRASAPGSGSSCRRSFPRPRRGPPGLSAGQLVLGLGPPHHPSRRHVVRELAFVHERPDPRVAAHGQALGHPCALAHHQEPAREVIRAHAVGRAVGAEADAGAFADHHLLVEDGVVHGGVAQHQRVVHDDAIAHRGARRHHHAREQDRAQHGARDAAAVGDQAPLRLATRFEAHRRPHRALGVDQPRGVVQVEGGGVREQVHVGLVVESSVPTSCQ
jgi:membrane-bound lytic murein transglycosylase D